MGEDWEEGCAYDDEHQRTRGISELSNETTESFIMDDADDTDNNNNNDDNNDNNNSNDDDNNCTTDECLKLRCEDTNSFYLLDNTTTTNNNTNNNNITTDNNNNNDDDDNNCTTDECLKLTCEDTNAFYLVDIGDGDLLKKVVNKKRSNDELQRKEYKFNRYNEGYPPGRNNRKWKYLSYILTIVIVLMVFAFLWEFSQIQEIKTRLMILQPETKVPTLKALKLQKLDNTKVIHRIPPKKFTALSLTGNGQVVKGRKGIPILNWRLHYQHGAIDFLEGKKIGIKKTGLYQLYAQMFFYKNAEMYTERNTTNNPVMDFGITKIQSNERIIAATVALSSCKVACTRHISSFVRLQNGDILIVETATPGVYFKMIEEKTLFGAYLVSDVEGKTDPIHPVHNIPK